MLFKNQTLLTMMKRNTEITKKGNMLRKNRKKKKKTKKKTKKKKNQKKTKKTKQKTNTQTKKKNSTSTSRTSSLPFRWVADATAAAAMPASS